MKLELHVPLSYDFSNGCVLRQFVPQRDAGSGEWRKLHGEELSDLYCSPNIIWVTKPRRMSWARYVARMGRGEGSVSRML